MIRTARLTLRPVRDDDLAGLHAVFSDPETMRYWSHPAHEDLDRTREKLAGMKASHAETGLEYVVTRAGEVIGKAGLWRAGEIGYILRRDLWGQGYGTEAVGAVVATAFARDPALAALTAEIDPRNRASAALLTKLGFRETHRVENAVEIAGEWCDSGFWRCDRPPR
ncbi:MAG: GNAT family N-acetyltransferase [Paracoccaceae bacterium]|nr:GNAT family N-acetyltransferase [Maritimibacter sp.]